ncbi:MAG: SpoIIE family protein phosphatase [Phycisphaerae bacterium]|nr:SpoIIE family protein phosphatase [Phycisphaerae bacterium]
MNDMKQNDDNAKQVIGQLDKQVRHLNDGLTSVYETARLLTSPMELHQVLDIVVKTIAESLGVEAAGLRLLDDETGELVLMATYGLSEEYKNKGPVTAKESELNGKALSGQAIVVEDMRTDPHFKRHHNAILREGVISNLSIGMLYKGRGIGILRLYSKKLRRFSAEDISLARTVASQSAAAIVNGRLYREALEGERVARQVRLAGEVQRRLIPLTPPRVAGLDLAGIYVPCHEVGGDFYDMIPLSENRLVLAIGDIMGKGIPASLKMATLRSSLRAYSETITSMGELLIRVNRMFYHDIELGEFATMFCAFYNSNTAALSYCNCGHEPPILIRNNRVIDLDQGGLVLGVDQNASYTPSEVTLEPNDMVVMYTDGLAEALNFEREMFGRTRIIKAARASADMSAQQAAKNILWLMRKFTGLTKRFDDTAIVVLKKL